MTKHPLLFVALLTLLSVVAALIILHFSPGEQGDFRLGMYEVQRNCPVLGSTLSRLASLRA